MFIKITQSGNRRYAQLVESFRNEEGKPRQRTVCTLGRLEAGGEVDTLIASLQRARGISPAAQSGRDPARRSDVCQKPRCLGYRKRQTAHQH